MELYGSLHNISGSVTASAFSGSFIGDGSGLTGIQASGVTGLNLSQIANADATASISSSGFTVNKNTQIQGNLAVTGSIIANEYIVSSSVVYMTTSYASGSSAFGNDNNDVHQFTGSVQITGSISLNGEPIGTGKLNETTFQSYTSSNNSRVSALETSSGSLNSFTSSIDTTIKSKLNIENVISGSVQVNITGTTGYSTFSSSVSSSIGDLSSSLATTTSGLTSNNTSLSSSVATTTNNLGNRVSSLETASGSIRNDFNSYTSSNDSTNSTQNSKLGFIETSTGSFNSFTSSINTTIKSKLDSDSVVSSSAQVNITGTTGYSTFSSSVNNLSSSIATTTSGLTSTITSLSSSLTSSIGTLSSSVDLLSSSVATTTLNLKNRVDSIETATSSLNSFTSSINTTIKSKLNNDGVISGSVQVNITGTTGYSTFSSSVSSSIGSLSSSVATTTSGISSTVTSLSSSVATTTSGLTSTITSLSSSVATTTSGLSSSIGSLSSSVATTTLNIQGRATSLEGKTGSYATTGSNIFQGDQTITGSLFVSQNLIIAGSSSINFVSQSTLNIGTNIITVNAQNPGTRFGGLAVIDSGSSPTVSGSMLFDSVNDQWLFVHQAIAGSPTTSSVLLMGPQTFNNIGSELYPTTNRIVKSVNAEHIGNSNIIDDGTTVTILSNTVINGTITSTGTTIVSGSSQISHDSTTGYVANRHIDHTAVSITAGNGLSGGGDISATRTVSLDTASATFTSGVKSKMNTDGVISGSSQVLSGTGIWSGSAQLPSGVVSGSSQVLAGTTIHSGAFFNGISVVSGSAQISYGGITGVPSGLVSGSSQITYGSLTGIPSGIVSGSSQITFGSISSIPSGLVSGSSQISLASTTGFGTYLNQAVLTTSTPTFSTVSATTFTGALSGNATTASTAGALYASTGLVTQFGNGTLGFVYAVTNPQTGLFTAVDNSNAIITINRHPGDYYSQLGFSSNGNLYYRSFSATAINTSQAWQTIWTSSSLTNLNQLSNGPGYITGINSSAVTTALGYTPYNATNPNGYITGINSSAVTTALGYTPYNSTNPSGYITGISFANVSSKPTTISGYGITDAITTGNIGSQTVSNSSQLQGLNKAQLWNNSGQNHSTYQTFAAIPNFGVWFMQASAAADTPQSASQYYVQTQGLGNDYAYGTYGLMTAVARDHAVKYTYYRTQENGTWGAWSKAAAGYADTAGSVSGANVSGNISGNASNITSYTINQSVGSSNSPTFANTYVSGVYLRNAAGKGWLSGGYGTYEDSTTTGAIYSIGGSYGPTSTSFSNMHGVGYTHTNSNLLPTGPGTNGWGFYVLTNGTPNVWLGAEGPSWFAYNINPKTNGAASLGNASYRWANVYTQDLHLSNDGKEGGNEIDGTTGDWTIQEGEENLYIINHKNGKKFKIDLTEII